MKTIAYLGSCLVGWLAFTATAGSGLSSAAEHSISIVDAGFGVPYPTAINNRGEMAGQGSDLRATLLDSTGEVITLGVYGDVYAMTDSGLLAVSVWVNEDVAHCALWSRQRGLTVLTEGLGTPISCLAWGINSRGEVVGAVGDSPASNGAYFWDAEGRAVRLPDLAGAYRTDAYDINEHGEVVGVAYLSSPTSTARAFRWTESSGLSLLPLPAGATGSSATAINNRGDIAGSVFGSQSMLTLWRANGEIVTIQHHGSVRDMNQRGWIVGRVENSAFLWIPEVGIVDLSVGVQSVVGSINDRGVVVGFAEGHDGIVWTIK